MSSPSPDIARLALQGAAAASATLLACRWFGVSADSWSWAVISALFVIQANADATVSAALARIGGTVLGTLVGLATVWVLGGEDATLWRVTIAAAVMSGVACLKPDMRYGAVAASVIALDPDPSVTGGALSRGAAIFLGSAVGSVVALTVWPQSAIHRARTAVTEALAACRELLQAEADGLTRGEGRKLEEIHARFLDHYRSARELADEAQLRGRDRRRALRDLVHTLSQLWHSLIIIDRFLSRPGGRLADDRAAEAIDLLKESACRHLEALCGGEEVPELDLVERHAEQAAAAVRRAARRDRPELEALAFSLCEVLRNLRDLNRSARALA